MSEKGTATAAIRPPEPEADQFWAWCQRGELRIQRCAACGRWVYFPAPRCYQCLSEQLVWTAVSGFGEVYTATIVHHALSPWFKAMVPYAVGWVELPEQKGLRILASIVGCLPEAVRPGLRVFVSFRESETGQRVPVFQPAV